MVKPAGGVISFDRMMLDRIAISSAVFRIAMVFRTSLNRVMLFLRFSDTLGFGFRCKNYQRQDPQQQDRQQHRGLRTAKRRVNGWIEREYCRLKLFRPHEKCRPARGWVELMGTPVWKYLGKIETY